MKAEYQFELISGEKLTFPAGTSFREIVATLQPKHPNLIVGVKFNYQIRELHYLPETDGRLELIDLAQEDGIRIYARTLSFILNCAAQDLFPGCQVRIEHSLSKGLYGEIVLPGDRIFNEQDLQAIAKRMQEMVTADQPIIKESISLEEAMRTFETTGQIDKVRLFKYRQNKIVRVYHCGKYTDYFYGYMLPATGFVQQFELKYYRPGFILRFPVKDSPQAIPEFCEQRKLARVFDEFEKWGQILEVADVGALNNLIAAEKGGELLRIAEALHEKKIAQIADQIACEGERIHLITIAGPSSSGKTTFAQRLMVQLRVNGLKPISISLDDYFVDRDHTPLDEDGRPDYECLAAIDVDFFNEQLSALINGFPVYLPRYNFQTGKREIRNTPLMITANQPIIIEGIHGLNEQLTESLPKNNKFKIYCSALTQLNIDNHNRIPTTDNRIIRRIVRDHQFRGHDALKTIGMWSMVRRGEEKHIFPYQEEADVMFNSALIYELAVLKRYAEPLLASIMPDCPEYSEAKRLLKFLSYFLPLEDQEVPLNSILREFIGLSCFKC